MLDQEYHPHSNTYLTKVKTIQYGPIYIKYLKAKFEKYEREYYKSSKETDVDELD